MLRGKTASGFSFRIDEGVRDDMELLEAITAYDAGERDKMPMILEALLGADQKKKLYEHCRGKNGRVSAKAVLLEIKSIFDEIQKSHDETKN